MSDDGDLDFDSTLIPPAQFAELAGRNHCNKAVYQRLRKDFAALAFYAQNPAVLFVNVLSSSSNSLSPQPSVAWS